MLSDLDRLSTIVSGMPLTMSARFLPRPALNAQEPSTSAQVGGSSFFLSRLLATDSPFSLRVFFCDDTRGLGSGPVVQGRCGVPGLSQPAAE